MVANQVIQRIAIIPARGGSKRIPQKNIVDFFGQPMIAWTIDAALQSGCFTQVLVSTDDAEIAHVSLQHGASVPFLRQQFADDHAPVSQATLTALHQAEAHWQTPFDTAVQLMPNCPLRTAQDIRRALAVFEQAGRTFQISCFKFGWMNPWWAARRLPDGRPIRLFPEAAGTRSQDLEPLYCPTGAIWIARAEALKSERSFYGKGHVFEPLAWTSAVDIDDAEDLQMAKAVRLLQHQEDALNA